MPGICCSSKATVLCTGCRWKVAGTVATRCRMSSLCYRRLGDEGRNTSSKLKLQTEPVGLLLRQALLSGLELYNLVLVLMCAVDINMSSTRVCNRSSCGSSMLPLVLSAVAVDIARKLPLLGCFHRPLAYAERLLSEHPPVHLASRAPRLHPRSCCTDLGQCS